MTEEELRRSMPPPPPVKIEHAPPQYIPRLPYAVRPILSATPTRGVTRKMIAESIRRYGIPRGPWSIDFFRGSHANFGAGVMPALLSAATIRTVPTILYALPTDDEEFSKVFGHPQSEMDRKALSNAQGLLSRNDVRLVKSAVAAIVAEQDVVFIIGRNSNGYLALPDGTRVRLDDIADACRMSGKLCFFIVCESYKAVSGGGLGIDYKISISNALRLVSALTDAVNTAPAYKSGIVKDKAAVFAQIREKLRDASFKTQLYGQKAGATIAVLLFVIWAEEDKFCDDDEGALLRCANASPEKFNPPEANVPTAAEKTRKIEEELRRPKPNFTDPRTRHAVRS